MAVITNYATLQTEVASTLAQADLTTFIPQFIQFAENKLYRTLNLRNEETALSVSVSSGTGTVPTDFKALKFAYVNESPTVILEWISIEELYRRYPTRTGSNTPKFISREGANFTFGPSAKDFTLGGIYYAKQDPLRTTDPSWYVTNAPELLLYGALIEAESFIKNDERLPMWKAMYDDAVKSIMIEERNSSSSKGKKQAWG
jgi:hypothetical protein